MLLDKLIREKYLTKNFILSKKYKKIMMKYYNPYYDKFNGANLQTKNYKYRHFRKNKLLGCWRWLGLFQNRAELAEIVFSNDLRGLDFGGTRGPVSLNIEICDRLEVDIFGRNVKYNNLNQIDNNSFDYVWSSHTLEHIENLEDHIHMSKNKLKKDGLFLLHIPSYTCKRWRASVHRYSDCMGDSNHKYTFYLSNDAHNVKDIIDESYIEIDTVVSKYLKVEKADMVGDNSIFIISKK